MTNTDFDAVLFGEFVAETSESLDGLDSLFIKLEEYPDREILDHIFRVMHTAKGNVSVFGFTHIKEFAHSLENLLDRIRQDKVHITVDIVDLLLNGKDLMAEMLRRQQEDPSIDKLGDDENSLLMAISKIRDEGEVETDVPEALQEVISRWEALCADADLPEVEELLGELKSLNINSGETSENQNNDLAEEFDYLFDSPTDNEDNAQEVENSTDTLEPEKTSEKKAANEKATIRVEQNAIDGFLVEVGNLITLSEGFKYLGMRMSDENVEHALRKDFQDISLSFHQLSMNLQQSVLQVRKVSIKSLVQKIPRMVRSLAKDLNKEVELKILGDETTLDKSLVDVLDDPLIHFIRNSLDHGIEAPQQRATAGKKSTGHLTVNAWADDDHFYLCIEDDGKGIDPELMRQLAIKKGLMENEEALKLSDQEAQEIVFLPGFSTAEVITDVSGRGVGMDVVMSNIRQVNGKVKLESIVGQGSKFTITLPLIGTTVVVQSLQFKVGHNIFVVPLDDIREVITPDRKLISTVQGSHKILKFRDRTIPITALKDLFQLKFAKSDEKDVVYIMIEQNQQAHALMIDELMGIQQVVIKEIDSNFKPHDAITGTALMGDGSIAMVIDCKSLSEHLEKVNS